MTRPRTSGRRLDGFAAPADRLDGAEDVALEQDHVGPVVRDGFRFEAEAELVVDEMVVVTAERDRDAEPGTANLVVNHAGARSPEDSRTHDADVDVERRAHVAKRAFGNNLARCADLRQQ